VEPDGQVEKSRHVRLAHVLSEEGQTSPSGRILRPDIEDVAVAAEAVSRRCRLYSSSKRQRVTPPTSRRMGFELVRIGLTLTCSTVSAPLCPWFSL
jgi:hypothetical protein